MPARVLLVRHGETVLNEAPNVKLRGWLDVPLSDRGEQEATKLADTLMRRGLVPDRIVSSDLERAQQTARVIQRRTHAPLRATRQLRPWNAGQLAGKAVQHVERDLKFYIEHEDKAPPDGESMRAFFRRFIHFLATQFYDVERSGEMVCLVCHTRNLRAAEGWWAAGMGARVDRPTYARKQEVPPGGGILFERDGTNWHLKELDRRDG